MNLLEWIKKNKIISCLMLLGVVILIVCLSYTKVFGLFNSRQLGTPLVGDTTTIYDISVSPSTYDLKVGETRTISVYATTDDGEVLIPSSSVSWSSSNSNLVSVSNGTITAKGAGENIGIIATYNGMPSTCYVTVTENENFNVSIPNAQTIYVGNSRTLSPTLSGISVDEVDISFSSDNTSVASVTDDGVVTGKMVGTATITVTATRTLDGAKRTDTCEVVVESNGTFATVEGNQVIAIAADVGTVTGAYQAKDSNNEYIKVDWSAIGAGATFTNCTDSISCSVTFSHQGNSGSVSSTTAKVTATDGGVSKEYDVTVYSYCAWNLVESGNLGPYSSSQYASMNRTRDSMKYVAGCDAYEGAYMSGGSWYFTSHYNRCCGSGTTPPTESESCYVKKGNGTENTYCYGTSSECSGYTEKLEGVDKDECSETPACYEDSNGDYVTGSYSGQDGYTYIGTSCPTTPPVEDEKPACYVNQTTGDYQWKTESPGEGYTIDSNITSESDCKKKEEPSEACYKNNSTGDYKWGEYSNDNNYTLVPDINDENACVEPVTPSDACYINNNTGKYAWGEYSSDSNYTLVLDISDEVSCKEPVTIPKKACYKHNITGKYAWGEYSSDSDYTLLPDFDEDECKNVIDVPMTSSNIATIIYVFVIILLSFGIYVIYYVHLKKMNN